jgi:glutathione S-transferase
VDKTSIDVLLSAAVTILAAILYLYMGIRVGQARGKTGIKAPAMTGAPELERAVRVHYNTLEWMPVFLIGLWLAVIYFSPAFEMVAWLPPLLGLVWIIGRALYMTGYTADPAKRSLGFGIQAIAGLVNLILAIIGVVNLLMMP